MIGEDFEITPTFRPRTKAEALELAHAWGNTLSHQDQCWTGGRIDVAMAAAADAAEVQRLAALATMLPTMLPDVIRRAGEPGGRALFPRVGKVGEQT